jgi:hypothetical protein
VFTIDSSTPTLTENLNEHLILSLPTEIVEKGTTLRPFMVKYHEKKRNFGLARLIREPGVMQQFECIKKLENFLSNLKTLDLITWYERADLCNP